MHSFWTRCHAAICTHKVAASSPLSEKTYTRTRFPSCRARCLVRPQSTVDLDAPSATMPAVHQPPAHLLPEIGRRSVLSNGASKGSSQATDQKLAPFACGMTGTPVEVPDARPCRVHGRLPQWLQGDLYRNGPGTFDIRTDAGQVFSIPHW